MANLIVAGHTSTSRDIYLWHGWEYVRAGDERGGEHDCPLIWRLEGSGARP